MAFLDYIGLGDESPYDWEGVKNVLGMNDPDTPDPTSSETEIMQYLQSYWINAGEQQKQLFPVIVQAFGYQVETDGTISKMPYEQYYGGLRPYEQAGIDILQSYYSQIQKGISGELPVSPALTKSLADERAATEQRLSKRLGPNYFLSTPGIQTEQALATKENITEEEARLNTIFNYGQLAQGQASTIANTETQRAAGIANLYNPDIASNLYKSLEPLQAYNLLPYQAEVAGQANRRQLWGDVFGAGGSALAAYYGASG
jgi:hypothetical protein